MSFDAMVGAHAFHDMHLPRHCKGYVSIVNRWYCDIVHKNFLCEASAYIHLKRQQIELFHQDLYQAFQRVE